MGGVAGTCALLPLGGPRRRCHQRSYRDSYLTARTAPVHAGIPILRGSYGTGTAAAGLSPAALIPPRPPGSGGGGDWTVVGAARPPKSSTPTAGRPRARPGSGSGRLRAGNNSQGSGIISDERAAGLFPSKSPGPTTQSPIRPRRAHQSSLGCGLNCRRAPVCGRGCVIGVGLTCSVQRDIIGESRRFRESR